MVRCIRWEKGCRLEEDAENANNDPKAETQVSEE